MSTNLTDDPAVEAAASAADADLEYRSVHTFAVLGLMIGLVSAVTLFLSGVSFETTLKTVPIPLAGLFVSLSSLRAITAAPELYTGKPLAQAGALLSAFFLLTGVGYAGYVHATEVPDGYERISFVEMKPSEANMVNRELVPPEVLDLVESGEKVFIKGYIRPDSIKYKQNINQFLLVRDNQECCFGDASKVKFFDQIRIQLATGMTTDFSRGLFRLGGVLKVGPGDPQIGAPLTYLLDADYVDP